MVGDSQGQAQWVQVEAHQLMAQAIDMEERRKGEKAREAAAARERRR